MNGSRLHRVLLTLWDIARENPNYNRKLWGELQNHLSQLQTRNNLLCALLSDLLHCTDDAGDVIWEEATIHSPPQGYAVKFIQEELQRERRPQMPQPTPVLPLDEVAGVKPPPTTMISEATECLLDDLSVDYGALNQPPLCVDDEYSGDSEIEDEADEFEFDFSSSDDLIG
jgi:hypothetical protein